MTPQERYQKLKEHLIEENPLLVDVIDEYKTLDDIAHTIGLLEKERTFTETISWWPLISLLGTFSAGKSTFINDLVGKKIQKTGNQAVDDKFTVICYSNKEEATELPGIALDADPRFPFYNISKEIEKVDPKEKNINRFLQLKAVKSDAIKGKILIDSPGFDADIQRQTILQITRHIIELSDLVLIFFDARHPEPGAMRDTLEKLVAIAKNQANSEKVLYILNQIDSCAQEDNLEDVVGAWQRALSQQGIVSGEFYTIYNESVAKIEDPEIKQRLKKKKDEDLQEIMLKMEKVVIDRAYRIVQNLEINAKNLLQKLGPLEERLSSYRSKIFWSDIVLLVLLGIGGYLVIDSLGITPLGIAALTAAVALFFVLHFKTKSLVRNFIAKKIEDNSIKNAFLRQTHILRPYIFAKINRKKIEERLNSLIKSSKTFIQKLNDQFVSMTKEA